MAIDIKVPSVGESVTEALLAQWYKEDGDSVQKDEPLFLLETDKVTLEVVAEADGILNITVKEGETVAVGAVVGSLEVGEKPVPEDKPPVKEEAVETPPPPPEAKPEIPEAPPLAATPAAEPAPLVLGRAGSVRRRLRCLDRLPDRRTLVPAGVAAPGARPIALPQRGDGVVPVPLPPRRGPGGQVVRHAAPRDRIAFG